MPTAIAVLIAILVIAILFALLFRKRRRPRLTLGRPDVALDVRPFTAEPDRRRR